MAKSIELGNQRFSHFGPEANPFKELEALFRNYNPRQGAQMGCNR
jgi:phosphoribulokinase